jgi:hypothetical protein
MSVEGVVPSPTIEEGISQLDIDEKPDGHVSNSTVTTEPRPEPLKLPFKAPASASTLPKPVELTADEKAKYDEVLQYMKSLRELPTSSNKKNKEFAPISEIEEYFLTRECILRYLRATKWHVNEAKKRLEGTIVWRREYGTDTLTAETIEPEVITPLSASLTRH